MWFINLLTLFSAAVCATAISTFVFFQGCNRNGFTCLTTNGLIQLTFTCPTTMLDVTVKIWDVRESTTTNVLVLNSCETLRVSFLSPGAHKQFDNLTITNIKNLMIIQAPGTVKNPGNLKLENITYLDYIPENVFSIPHMIIYNGNPDVNELREISFKRVNIGTIQTSAFNSLRLVRNFEWEEVTVGRIEASAIRISFNHSGSFTFRNCSFEVVEHLGFQFNSKLGTFINNKFVEIAPSGINGTIENFNFLSNQVNTLQYGSMSILSKTVRIMDNRFSYLRSGSFEKISPGLLIDSHTNFGKLEFKYTFNNNKISFVDAGSLNPDIEAYDKVATDLVFDHNTFLCSCENLGWLVTSIGHGYSSKVLTGFYETLLEKESKNICSDSSCSLPISSIKRVIENGKCVENITLAELCKPPRARPIARTTIYHPTTIFRPTIRPYDDYNFNEPSDARILTYSSGSNMFCSHYFFSLICSIRYLLHILHWRNI